MASSVPPWNRNPEPFAELISAEAIATRAYILWEKDGRPPGRDMEYWLKAESQLKDTQSFSA